MSRSVSPVSRLLAGATGVALVVGGALLPVTPAAAAPPQPATVTAASSDGSIAFGWDPVPGASAYRLEVSRSGNFTGSAADTAASITTYATDWIAPTTLDLASAGQLWYRVSAFGSGTTESTRGEPSIPQALDREALAPPAPLAPEDGATLNYPTAVAFSWSPVPGAVSYDVEYVAGEFASSSATPVTATTTATTFVPQKPLDPGLSYEWHVRANYYSGTSTPVPGALSGVRTFTVEWSATESQPRLLSPANSGSNPIVSDPQLRWSPVSGAKEYQVRLGTSKDSYGNIVSPTLATVTGTAYIPPNTAFSNTNYFWQVVAYDANGGAGTPSAVWQFKKALSYSADPTTSDAPADFYPEPLTGSSDPGQPEQIPLNQFQLSWNPVPRATLYQVEVVPHNGTDPRLTCRTASTSATVVAAFTSTGTESGRLKGAGDCLWSSDYTKRIRPDVSYTWRVRAVDYLGSSTTGLQNAVSDKAITSDWSDEEVTGQDSRKRWFTVTQPTISGADTTSTPVLDLDTFAATQTIDSLAGQPAPLLTWKPFDFGLAADQWQRVGYEVTVYAKGVGSSTQVAVVRTPQTQLRINGVFDDNEVDEPYSASVRPFFYDVPTRAWTANIGLAYHGDSSAGRFVWTKTSKTLDVSPGAQALSDGTVVLAWTPQYTTAKLDGGSRGYAITIRDSAEKVVGAAGYKVDLPFLVAQNTSTTKPLPQGNYTYEVAPLDANGNATRFSQRAPFSISLPPPAVQTAATAVGASQAVAWSPSTAAFKYQLQYKAASASSTTWTTVGGLGTTVGGTDRVQSAHVFTDLAPADYVWKLRAVDVAGNYSAWSPEQAFTIGGQRIEQTTPDRAVLPVVDRVLRWKPVPEASRYVVEVSSNANLSSATTYETVATALALPTSMTAGTTYYWRVKAVPEVANSSTSRPILTTSAIQSFSVRTIPVAVKSPKATGDGTTLQVTWAALTGADAGTTEELKYSVQVRQQGLVDDWSDAQTITTKAAATSTLVTGLASATTYEARVSAINSEGQGPWSAVVSGRTASAPAAAPSLWRVVSGVGTLTLSWRAPTGVGTGGSPITGYVVRYRTSGADWAQVKLGPVDTYTLGGLAGDAQYSIEVAAVNAIGTGPAATATSTTLGVPGLVTGFTVARGDRSAKLTWVAPTTGSALTGYDVQQRAYNASSKQWSSWVTAAVTTTSRTVTGLVNGTTYQFRVAARTKVGTGSYSAALSVTPAGKPGASPKLAVTATKGKFTIAWKAAANNGSALTAYVVQYSANGKSWTGLATTSGKVLKVTTTKGKKGKTYSFRVIARNAVGDGPYSKVVKAKKK